MGENGAGKSTLMKILYGMQRPDEGTIRVDGERGRPSTRRSDAIAAGIGMVHQHFMLADNLTVLENVVLGSEPTQGRLASTSAPPRRGSGRSPTPTASDVDPDALVEDLGVGERQRVEILKVLYRGARILILDEPTAVLVPQEVDELFDNLRELKDEGLTIIFISHKLDEVLAVADAITVIRRGTTVATVDPATVTARAAGRADGRQRAADAGDPRVHGHRRAGARGRGADASVAADGPRRCSRTSRFTIHRGEVARHRRRRGQRPGRAGRGDHGHAAASTGGRIQLGDEDIADWSTRRRREAGIGYIPEDRQRHGLLLDAPLWENRMLGHQTEKPNVKGVWIDRGGARADTERIVARVRRPHPGHRRARPRRCPAATSRS